MAKILSALVLGTGPVTGQNFLGDNFLAYLTLALGAALAGGNLLALLNPRPDDSGEMQRAPLGRSLMQITVGSLAAIWSLATIVS
ncbi:MAG: hypothetical protein AAF962_06925 [Actinomycetota bacterium]